MPSLPLYWYTCISINTDCYLIYNILLGIVWWVLSNTSLIVWIHSAIPEIIANKTCSYWWSNILVISYYFCTSYIYANSSHLELSYKKIYFFDFNTAIKAYNVYFYNPDTSHCSSQSLNLTITPIISYLLLIVILLSFQTDILDISTKNISDHVIFIISPHIS